MGAGERAGLRHSAGGVGMPGVLIKVHAQEVQIHCLLGTAGASPTTRKLQPLRCKSR